MVVSLPARDDKKEAVGIALESPGRPALSDDPLLYELMGSIPLTEGGVAGRYSSAAEALSALGEQGWEVVDFMGGGRYLMKRPL